MSDRSRIVIDQLMFTGPERTPVSVQFKSGVNIIWGASNTGKSFVRKSIDYLLGGELPTLLPEGKGMTIISCGPPSLAITKSPCAHRRWAVTSTRQTDISKPLVKAHPGTRCSHESTSARPTSRDFCPRSSATVSAAFEKRTSGKSRRSRCAS